MKDNHKDSDPFEEFEFRPLNEGLGFHKESGPKKAPTPIEPALKAKILESKNDTRIETRNDGGLGATALSTPLLKTALPRKSLLKTPASMPIEPLPNADKILAELNRQNLDFKERTQAQSKTQKEKSVSATTTNYSLSALILDGMLLTAAFLTCLIILLMVTKVDLMASLSDPEASPMLYSSLGALFAILAWMYLVIHRMGLGATTGEWVFDIRLGTPEQFNTASYLLKTSLRSLIIVATGLVIIPIISLIAGKDLLGRWLGVELQNSLPPTSSGTR